MLTELKVFNFFHVLCLVIRRLKLCCGLGAGGDGHADLLGVQVVVDEPVNDGGQLGLHQRVAGGLEVGQDCAEGRAQLGWVEMGSTCSTNSTICCSVVSLVRNSSMSVTTSMQMAHVRALLDCSGDS